MGGYGASQLIRLASNVVLSRLLFPEAFGLMAIVNLFIQGLAMFSDVGITPAIVHHKEGTKDSFLNTAWTMQIVRGGVLWLCCCILAVPVSLFYGENSLRWLLPAAGLNAVVLGFRSTAMATLTRKLLLGRQTLIEIFSQVVAVTTMVAIAWVKPTVWALIAGGLTSAFVSVVLSHVALPGIRHRLTWDRTARSELFRFGKWITVSTAFTFLASQGDRAILSTFVSIGMVGIYSVAANLVQAIQTLFGRLSNAVLFPVYASWERESTEKLQRQFSRVRTRTLWWFLLPPCGLAIIGEPLIRLLYDSRYHEAGWMLTLMSVALIFHVLVITVDPILLATGDSYRHMVLTISKGAVVFVAMAIGGYWDGTRGLLLGSIAGRALQYPLMVAVVRSKRVWMPWLDVAAIVGCGIAIAAGRFLVTTFL